MADRDDLAALIIRHQGDNAYQAADEIIAAGWVPRSRLADAEGRAVGYEANADHFRGQRDALSAALQRVWATHTKAYTDGHDGRRIPYCVEDSEAAREWVSWPCPTARALDSDRHAEHHRDDDHAPAIEAHDAAAEGEVDQ